MIHRLLSFKRCWLLFFLVGVTSVYAEKQVIADKVSTSQITRNQVITIGTGGVTGLYYPTGGALCRLVNQAREKYGIRCAVRSTLGSVSNLEKVINHELDMGIAEAGQLYNFVKDTDNSALKNADNHADQWDQPLRTLTSLYPEYISILVRSDANIHSFDDLKQKRVNIGRSGTSQRSTIDLLMKDRGWQLSDFSSVSELEPSEQANALCDNRIDATLYVVGHPSGTIKEALRDCNSQLMGLSKQDRETLMLQNPFYREMTISGGFYSPDLSDVLTIGVNATLFARADLPDDVVYAVVKSLFDQFDNFRKLHPAFRFLNPEQMMQTTTLPLPIHPGAAKYFREVGYLLQIPPE